MAAQQIIVASSKGGVGKSTVALGVAGALIEEGKSVLLCDVDFENRCLDLFIGLENTALFNIADVAEGTVSASKALIKNGAGLSFISAPDGINVSSEFGSKTITFQMLKKALTETISASKADFVIFDTGTCHDIPAFLADTFPGARALVVASHQLSSRRAAENTASMLANHGIKDSRLVICGYELKEAVRHERTGIIEIIDSSKVRLIGVIPYDKSLMLSHERGIKPPSDSPSSIAFGNIAKRLCGKNIRLFDGIGSIKRNKFL